MFSSRIGSAHAQNAIAEKVALLKAAGSNPINLADSNPTRCGLLFPDLLDCLPNPGCANHDPDPRGMLRARTVISERTGTRPDDIFLSASTSEAYAWLFKLLCDPGDSVLVPKPGYPLFDYLASLEGIIAQPYRMEYTHPDGWRIDLDGLEDSLRTGTVKAVVLIHPNNPSGSYVRETERKAIVRLCKKFDAAIIADEVFLPYNIDAQTPAPSFASETGCLTFTLDGLSKLMCLPQLKLGWMLVSGPAELKKSALERLEIIADTYLSVGTVPMHAVTQLMPKADAFVREVQARLRINLDSLRKCFEYSNSPYRVYRCEAGWTALLEIPRILSEEAIVLDLLETCGILVHPGYFFDCEREGILAISLIVPPEIFTTGIAAMQSRLNDLVAL